MEEPPTPSRALDRDSLARWIAAAEHDGRVLAWWHPDEPGYPYDEAAALWLGWAAWRGHAEGRHRVAARLLAALDAGGLGRKGQRYLFDSCLAVHALVRAGADFDLDRALDVLEGFDDVVQPLHRPSRWSERWTGHLLRGAGLLLQAGHIAGSHRTVQLARTLRARAVEPTQGYVHALAYATEGELIFRALGEAPGPLDPRQVANTLVALQANDGTLPGWDDGREPIRLDATAQAVRIWCVVDRAAYAEPIEAALRALGRWQHPCGGVQYDTRGHVNSWTSLFADQAAAWARDGVDEHGWI